MQPSIKQFLILSCTLLFASLHAATTDQCPTFTCNAELCKSQLLPFSAGENRARDYSQIPRFQYHPDQEEFNWYITAAVEYQQNFNQHELGSYFFPTGNNTITVGPNGAPDTIIRNVDIGLSDTFQGTFTIRPTIKNIIFEPSLYLGLDRWCENLWLWTKIPMVNSRWKLDCCETNSSLGGTFFAQVSEMQHGLSTQVPASGTHQIEQALNGSLVWGDKITPLNAARFICCNNNITAIADLPVHLGYNFVSKDAGYFGLYLRTAFPTGRQNHHRSVFDARVGYNRWQLGVGLNTGLRVYEHSDDTSLNLLIDTYIVHLFNRSECRVFDLAQNGCFSRYLLMKEADVNGNYTGRLANFVDIFTACVESKIPWAIDGLFFLEFRHYGWNVDIGYEVKSRAHEDFVPCATTVTVCDPCTEDCCNTKSCATCTPNQCCPNSIAQKQYGIKGTLLVDAVGTPVTTANTSNIQTAGPQDAAPILISTQNITTKLDFQHAKMPGITSHKVWGSFGYSWEDREYPIFVSVNAEGEFGDSRKVVNMWGCWFKIGATYY